MSPIALSKRARASVDSLPLELEKGARTIIESIDSETLRYAKPLRQIIETLRERSANPEVLDRLRSLSATGDWHLVILKREFRSQTVFVVLGINGVPHDVAIVDFVVAFSTRM